MLPAVENAHARLHAGTCQGSEWLGWLNLPTGYNREELTRIKAAAKRIRETADILVVVGIGGSYLGAHAALQAVLGPQFNALACGPKIYFAGNSLSPVAVGQLLKIMEGKRVALNVISKSGTTTEPAVAFRVLKSYLEEKMGKEAAQKNIYITTDPANGALRRLAQAEGYETFNVPEDVGGRYSVLTAVGLLPLAAAGLNVDDMLHGAKKAQGELAICSTENACYQYAMARYMLYTSGKKIELFTSYEPGLTQFGEWFKQLFGESEGKGGKGIFPAAATYSTDLHSMGQLVQSGERNLFETVLWVENHGEDVYIATEQDNFDGMNYLAGQGIAAINKQAMLGTLAAHTAGGVPCILLTTPSLKEEDFGYMVYFFEKACAISALLLGVNPFDQPGVEQYKKNMFALLGKPGFEAEREELLTLLSE